MGMFDSIRAKLECPDTKESLDREIQIKWRDQRLLDNFKIGDLIENLYGEYDNNWIRAGYVCQSCSKKAAGKYGPYIKRDDQKWHYCFVRIENKRIAEVLAEEEFYKKNIEDYLIYD